jgi:hypothetical protein
MVAAKAIARTIVMASLCVTALGVAAAPAGDAADTRLRFADGQGSQRTPTEVDIVAALGRYWGEPELRDALVALGVETATRPVLEDRYAFLFNRAQGLELTFWPPDALDVPLRAYPADAVVLVNIRMYGEKTSRVAPFAGDLPFGLRFDDTRQSLIAKLGPPAAVVEFLPVLRWDRDGYALFVRLSDAGTIFSMSVQLPVVPPRRPTSR